MYYC
jgi:hypothetical protein